MRYGAIDTESVLQGSFDVDYETDVVYDGELRVESAPITDVAFSEDGSSAIQQSGSCTVVWSDEFARSISPRQIGDVLAPFGSELHLYAVVKVGERISSRTRLGVFPITNVPSAMDKQMRFRGEWITLGSNVKLEFKDLSARLDRDPFDVPTAPTSLASMWAEVGRITGEQLTRSVPDVVIPRSVMYQDNRLDAVGDLLQLADAVLHVTSDGTVSARPNVWPAPVSTLRRGDGGSIVEVGQAMDPTNVYNRVAFRGKADAKGVTPILATAEVTQGPLRVRNPDGGRSPFGRKTKFYASDFVTSVAQAQAYMNQELPRVAQLGVVVVPVVETFNQLRERGDVIRFERFPDEFYVGRILSIDRSKSATMSMKVQVLES